MHVKIIILIIGIFIGNIINYFGNKLSNIRGYKYSSCDNCKVKSSIFLPLINYIINKGKCKNCKRRLSILPIAIEFITPILLYLAYINFNVDPVIFNLLYAFLFIIALLIIYVSDIKNMIIPDEVLVVFGILIAATKLYIMYYNEEIANLMDLGYEIIFLLYEGFFMFLIMYVIKLVGDFIFKKDSMGGGDVKLMFFVSMFIGWKLSLCILFLSAFLALPESAINMIKNKENMLAFGPYIVISTLIIFISNIDINTILSYLK